VTLHKPIFYISSRINTLRIPENKIPSLERVSMDLLGTFRGGFMVPNRKVPAADVHSFREL
jgi:hypothetical protein